MLPPCAAATAYHHASPSHHFKDIAVHLSDSAQHYRPGIQCKFHQTEREPRTAAAPSIRIWPDAPATIAEATAAFGVGPYSTAGGKPAFRPRWRRWDSRDGCGGDGVGDEGERDRLPKVGAEGDAVSKCCQVSDHPDLAASQHPTSSSAPTSHHATPHHTIITQCFCSAFTLACAHARAGTRVYSCAVRLDAAGCCWLKHDGVEQRIQQTARPGFPEHRGGREPDHLVSPGQWRRQDDLPEGGCGQSAAGGACTSSSNPSTSAGTTRP